MKRWAAASASAETPVFIRAGSEALFGILTRPVTKAHGVGVLIAMGGSPTMVCFQRNRVAVHLARSLAGMGFHVLRFDYHGSGDSSGNVRFSLDNLFTDDLLAAAGCLQEQGVDRLALVGTCYGARTILSAASKLDGVEAIVLAALSTTSHDANPELIDTDITDQLAHLARNRLPTLVLYGHGDPYSDSFLSPGNMGLQRLLAENRDVLELRVETCGGIHGHRTLAGQDVFRTTVEQWLQERVGPRSGRLQLRADRAYS